MRKAWSTGRLNLRDSCSIFDPLIIMPIQFLITYDLRRSTMAILVISHFYNLKKGILCVGFIWVCMIDSIDKKWENWKNKGKNQRWNFEIGPGDFEILKEKKQ